MLELDFWPNINMLISVENFGLFTIPDVLMRICHRELLLNSCKLYGNFEKINWMYYETWDLGNGLKSNKKYWRLSVNVIEGFIMYHFRGIEICNS